jgi:hypothetical protein
LSRLIAKDVIAKVVSIVTVSIVMVSSVMPSEANHLACFSKMPHEIRFLFAL